MVEYNLSLEKRELVGKKVKKIRDAGEIPSVVFGEGKTVLLKSKYNPTEKVLNEAGYHSPISLDVEGEKQLAIVKSVQLDPVSRRIINVEFQAISASEVVTATTPIVIKNFEASEASRTYHFAMTVVMDEIEVKAKPANLPSELEIDASNLASVDDKLTISDLQLPAGVELADKELESEQVVASLYDPVAEAEKRETEAEAETAPADGEAAAENTEAKAE